VLAAIAACLALVLAGFVALAPAAAARQEGTPGITGETNPTVRIVHASPDGPAVDILVDGQPVAENVAFGAATAYAPLAPGDHQVQVVPAGGGDPVIDQTITLDGSAAYILAAVGAVGDLQLQVNQVNLDAVPAGQARFRVIHAVPDGPAVDVAVAGNEEPLVGGAEFGGISDYQEITAGAYDLDVRAADGGQVVTAVEGLALESGQVYDIFAIGQAGANNVSLLPLATQATVPCGQTLGISEQTSDACLRVVHAVRDGGPVDVYVGETAAVQGLEYGAATEFLAAPSGEQQLRVVPAGGALDQAIVDTTQDLGAGQAFQVTAAGGPDQEINAWVSGVDLAALPENQAKVRVVHASPDTAAVDVSVAGDEATTPFDAVAYGSQSGYVAFNAGSYTFQLRLDDGDTLLLEAADVPLAAGTIYDVYAIGSSEDGTLQLVVYAAEVGILQGTTAAATPVGMATPMATPMAEETTPVVAVGSTPVVEEPGAATPAATPTDQTGD
jgi:hypothetical protein